MKISDSEIPEQTAISACTVVWRSAPSEIILRATRRLDILLIKTARVALLDGLDHILDIKEDVN